MSERASRILFLAEAMVLALPSLCFFAMYAVLFGAYAFVGSGAMVVTLVGQGDVTMDGIGDVAKLAALFALVVAICGLGLFAIGAFVRVAWAFWRRGRRGFGRERRRFRQGLAGAVPPLAIMVPFAWIVTWGGHPADALVGFYASGLALGPPILHLYLELRRSPGAASGA